MQFTFPMFAAALVYLLWPVGTQSVPPCASEVFCQGDFLRSVQLAAIFDDSKEFVDRPLKADPDVVLSAFRNLSDNSTATLRQFVYNWTDDATSDVIRSPPHDWVESPAFVSKIEDPSLREWTLSLNELWKEFGKEVGPSVSAHPDRHSLLPLPHLFIAPGADSRFSEIYYWDSYWIIQGILLCEMRDTARGMIENLAHLIDKYGLVPNGGRIYYTGRSQPPLLTQMVELYYNDTGNATFLEDLLPYLVKEHTFWLNNRSVEVDGRTWIQYAADTTEPRPESYREDYTTAMELPEASRPELYSNLASGAESGWDFSTRWFARDGPHAGKLSSIRTREIIPVDLNAILCQNELTLSRLWEAVGNSSAAAYFKALALLRQRAFDELFWNETEGLWFDWDRDTGGHLVGFYASSLVPLYWGCGQHNITRHKLVLGRLKTLGVLDYPGGIPTSLANHSNQQWDYPNAWAPLQWFPVLGWFGSAREELRDAARAVAQTWIATTYAAWKKYNMTMFEKYNCTVQGEPGSGGEYVIQSGFGWTNGIVLHFLSLYPDLKLSPSSTSSDSSLEPLAWLAMIALLPLTLLFSSLCVLWSCWIFRKGRARYWARVQNEHLLAAGGGTGVDPPTSPIIYSNEFAAEEDYTPPPSPILHGRTVEEGGANSDKTAPNAALVFSNQFAEDNGTWDEIDV